jgi:hypothetical protein
MRVGCLVHQIRYRGDAHTKERHHDHLRLKERGEVRLRPHLSGHPCGMHTVFGAVGPGQRAVHDRIALPDAKMPQGPLARVTGAAPPVGYGALHGLALPVGHPHMELVLRSLALLKPDARDLPLVLKSHRPLEEPC